MNPATHVYKYHKKLPGTLAVVYLDADVSAALTAAIFIPAETTGVSSVRDTYIVGHDLPPSLYLIFDRSYQLGRPFSTHKLSTSP